jgi:pimeloyl-ACP methyl ester carboxylesterase
MTTTIKSEIGGIVKTWQWQWRDRSFTIAYETRGSGDRVLLLPAFSTVSTRGEVKGVAEELASKFQVIAIDWLGFGQSERPKLDYRPDLYCQLLQDFVRAHFDCPIPVVAAGHAAGYGMQVAQQKSCPWSKMVLVAPTWKGPLKVMGAPAGVRDGVRELVRSPFVGQVLYSLNTAPAFLKFMYRQHVYADASNLTPEFMQQKYDITQQTGARYAPAAFVTGTLDPMASSEEFIAIGRSLNIPVKVIIGQSCPARSRAEMEALAQLPSIESDRLPGSLGLHEEYAKEVAKAVLSFL